MSLILVLLSVVSAGWSQEASKPAPIPGFDAAALDKTADPCGDFFQFSCGGWLAKNEIPADQSRWGRFQELAERNRQTLRDILEKTPAGEKIGDYYASCMDEKAIESKGTGPLAEELALIDGLKTPADVGVEFAHLHKMGVSAGFGFGSSQDYKDASKMTAEADQGGLGLPERDYYLKTDAKSEEQRRQYLEHVYKMLRLTGEDEDRASLEAHNILRLETKMAKVSQDIVFRRDPDHLYHKMSKKELAALAPNIAWDRYFTDVDAPSFDGLNVVAPEYLKGLNELLSSVPLEDWKAYLRWHLVHAEASMLPAAFVNEDFDFYGKKLSGAKELKARWKRCVESTDGMLGEALGKRYVEKTFGAQGKKRTLAMVKALEKALEADLKSLDWMTPKTKAQAQAKLKAITNKIGYPDKYRDYSKYQVLRGDALGNLERGRAFERKRRLDKIGKPVDKNEWEMTPPTVNAYYDPQMNNINFPAGILQPPFYDNAMDDAVNFGGIGAVIGHELTHGFDDEGRKFDAKGNLSDWWTAEDAKAFESRAQCLVDEYGSFVAVGDVKLNGKLTLGENTADNGGLRLAEMALEDTLKGKKPAPIDGFSPQQRLFLGWGQIWCEKRMDAVARLLALTNPHSPGRNRVNGVVANMPEFAKAFNCPAGKPMVSPKACRVW